MQTLVDFAARELGFNLMYEPGVLQGAVRVQLETNMPIDRRMLRSILDTALRIRGYAAVDLDAPGFKRIARIDQAVPAIPPDLRGRAAMGDTVVVRAIRLDVMTAAEAVELVGPVLSSPAHVVHQSEPQRTLLLVDTAERIRRAEALIRRVEGVESGLVIRTVRLEHALARDVANTVRDVITAKMVGAGQVKQADSLRVLADNRTNQVVISMGRGFWDEAEALIRVLDSEVKSRVTPVKRYKLTNTTARGMLRTLEAVAGGHSNPFDELRRSLDQGLGFEPGGHGDTGRLSSDAPFPGSGGNDEQTVGPGAVGVEADGLNRANLTLAADVNTNSIIVVADPATQEIYAGLIELLDERRPQVQIEATLVSLNTTNDYALGVEFGVEGSLDEPSRLITFSSFGISTVDPVTGSLTPAGGAGLTSAVLDADFVDVVLNAFEQDGNSRVLSAPTLLVNDNTRGRLQSLVEEPTVSITQGEVSDQVSFLEYVEAGTTIDVIPYISEGGYLQLEYRVIVNSFLASDPALAAAGVPPPRVTDALQSRVTIPDDHTIVVGGLTSKAESETIEKVPYLGDIPLVGELFKRTTTSHDETTLFVFLRPTILADDDFADLRGLSEDRLRDAGLPGNEPYDAPTLILD
ncbi:MAG: secretin N-terminal domain-containing protein [Planctomycetota bacterium]